MTSVVFLTKELPIAGSSFKEVEQEAIRTFRQIKSQTKRTPYVRSKYFRGEKIFLSIFWIHLYEKHEKDRTRRLRWYRCALDCLRNSRIDPETHENFEHKDELLHRFFGQTKAGEHFVVQVKEHKRTRRKDFISVYPAN